MSKIKVGSFVRSNSSAKLACRVERVTSFAEYSSDSEEAKEERWFDRIESSSVDTSDFSLSELSTSSSQDYETRFHYKSPKIQQKLKRENKTRLLIQKRMYLLHHKRHKPGDLFAHIECSKNTQKLCKRFCTWFTRKLYTRLEQENLDVLKEKYVKPLALDGQHFQFLIDLIRFEQERFNRIHVLQFLGELINTM